MATTTSGHNAPTPTTRWPRRRIGPPLNCSKRPIRNCHNPIGLRRCRFRLAVAQVRLSGEQVVQGCLHGVVVQVGVVEREVRGSARRPPAEVRATCRRSANVSACLGFHVGFSGLLTELLDVGPRGRFRAPAPARAAVAAVQVADFPRRPVCSARSRPCPLLCGYGDAGASLVG